MAPRTRTALRTVQQAHTADQVLRHLLPAGRELQLPPPRFFQGDAFPLQFLLLAFEFGELLLRLSYF